MVLAALSTFPCAMANREARRKLESFLVVLWLNSALFAEVHSILSTCSVFFLQRSFGANNLAAASRTSAAFTIRRRLLVGLLCVWQIVVMLEINTKKNMMHMYHHLPVQQALHELTQLSLESGHSYAARFVLFQWLRVRME